MPNTLEKLEAFVKLAKTVIPEATDEEIYRMGDHLARFQNRERSVLSDNEKVLYDLCVRNSINPTVLRVWIRCNRLPEDLKVKIRQNRITLKKARDEMRDRNKNKDQLAQEILHDIRQAIRMLRNADKTKLGGGGYNATRY